MHVVMFVAFGLLALAAFWLIAWLLNRRGFSLDGAGIFIPVWLLSALVNAAVGFAHVGIPLVNEIGAFIPIFGIPAAIAWYLSRRHRAGAMR
jgi:hypothetical protein